MVVDDLPYNPILFVVFGIPGAGKTTIAKHVVQKLLATSTANVGDGDGAALAQLQHSILDLDLDDCVPEWMRLNFAQWSYPNLQQRNQFADSCCDYVNESIQKFIESTTNTITRGNPRQSVGQQLLVLVSFSFVNEDLRIHFRQQFQNSRWILIHTSEIEAQRRIEQRNNHFYKGKPKHHSTESIDAVCHPNSSDNHEWNFAPVTFPHTIINGHNPIEQTSYEIVALIRSIVPMSSSMINEH
jgi:gluconate kinase